MTKKANPLKGNILKYELRNPEKLPITIWNSSVEASIHIAASIGLAIRQKQQEGEMKFIVVLYTYIVNAI